MAKGSRKMVDATDNQIGQDGIVTMSTTGEAILARPDIEIVDGPAWEDRAAELAFMEEPVEVVVHESPDPQAEDPVPTFVNGRAQWFFRGQPVTVKRKYVERLARAKPIHYKNEEYTEADGGKAVRWPKRSTLHYPFAVLRDDNPKGRPWLRKILAEV